MLMVDPIADRLTMKKAGRYGSSHKKLRSVWDAKKKDLNLTQESAAYELGFNGQSAVSNYLNGYQPLNLQVAIKFARLLKVDLSEIWEGDPEVAFMNLPLEQVEELAQALPYEEQLELARRLLANRRDGQD